MQTPGNKCGVPRALSRSSQRGFTLIELIVAFAIIGILAVVSVSAFINQREYQRVTTVAKRVDSLLRLAQVRATTGSGHEGDFSAGYGVYFNETNSSYAFFADLDASTDINSVTNDFIYSSGSSDEILNQILVSEDLTFSICAGSDKTNCDPAVAELNVVYLRPYLSPAINDDTTAAGCSGTAETCGQYQYAEIEVSSSKIKATSSLEIYSTGRRVVK